MNRTWKVPILFLCLAACSGKKGVEHPAESATALAAGQSQGNGENEAASVDDNTFVPNGEIVARAMAGPIARLDEFAPRAEREGIDLPVFDDGPRLAELDVAESRETPLHSRQTVRARLLAFQFNDMERTYNLAVNDGVRWFISPSIAKILNQGVMGVSERFELDSFVSVDHRWVIRYRTVFEDHGGSPGIPVEIERRESRFLVIAAMGESGVPSCTMPIKLVSLTRFERTDLEEHPKHAADERVTIDAMEPFFRFDGDLELNALTSSTSDLNFKPGRYRLVFP